MELGEVVTEESISVGGSDGLTQVLADTSRETTGTLRIKTRLGYEVEGTPEHGLRKLGPNGPEWSRIGDLKPGDLVGLQFNQQLFQDFDDITDIKLTKRGTWTQPGRMTEELANIIGLFIAEGSYRYCVSSNMLRIYNTDKEVIDRLINNNLGLNFIAYPKSQCVYLCNARFIEFLIKLGFGERNFAETKFIPRRLLRCSRPVLRAMLSGMFDGDGHSSRYRGTIGYTSTSKLLIDQVRMLLLNFGIISKINKDQRKTRHFTNSRAGKCDRVSQLHCAHQLNCSPYFSKRFYNEIGFGIQYKQAKMFKLLQSKEQLFGLNDKFRILKKKYGCGSLGFDSIRRVLKAEFCTFDTACKKIISWDRYNTDPDYLFVAARLDEFDRPRNNIIWLPIISITASTNPVCEISVSADDHTYIANGFISHNSQVARTVILAFVKKEGRDRKNACSYKDHLTDTQTIDEDRLKRFFTEAEIVCKYNRDHMKCLRALQKITRTDNKPSDGLIGKLVEQSGLSRCQVASFIKIIRLRSHEFSDSPLSQEDSHDRQLRGTFLYQEED
jgi:intein/homing endonuclease